MFVKKTMYLYCSMVFLAIIATIVGFNAYNNMWIGLLSAFVVVIPSVYSLIPLIMEYRKSKNVRKNKLTESIFTDRKEDLEDIIRILNVKEHCIQITGEEEQCGKTWMAKRLCDYINNQNDPEFRDMKLKCAYVTADYLDMDNYTEMELNAYFKDNIVTNKTVLIFDHVDNFKIILSKQRQFHFQMIYILKYNASPSLTTHTMSAFCQNHIEELQRKIKEYYPGISVLTQNEVDTLFQLTDGNIGRITALLSEQKCVLWIKDISNKKTTEYEECLHKIEMDILVGIPHIAQPMLPPQLRREQVGQPVRSLVQPLPDGAVEQALPHARRQRIDRHDAAGDVVQPLPLKGGIRHRPPQQRPLDRAVERVALAHVERVFQVRLVEVRQLQRGALIHHAQLDELQSLSDARELRLRRHHRRHAGALTDLQLRDAAALPPVLVGAREIGDEAFQVCDAELRKALRPRRCAGQGPRRWPSCRRPARR